MKLIKPNTQTFLVALCMLVGILLRLWNPSELAFINDELSTWDKLNYDSIGGLIQNIKVDDSHPVGMYVFLYYWTAIFGTSVWAIKLPFALMSVASMALVYQLSKRWFNPNVALLVLAYFASLQYPIWWAAIARQYQSGLFYGLIMLSCWTAIVLDSKVSKKYWIGFVLAGTAAMYNHYFSLIFAALVGGLGLVWIDKKKLLPYLGAGAAMVALFLPHLAITLHQLSHADGHTWYAVPESSFLSQHIFYIFHYSPVCLGLIVLIASLSLLFGQAKEGKSKLKIRLTALVLFLFPLLFGYFYSVYVSPILRTSHLLFSFPFLLIFLLSFVPEQLHYRLKTALVLLILLVNSYTLVNNRRHFETMNSHPYRPFVAETKAFLSQNSPDSVHIVLGENPVYLQYYKTALGANFEHIESFRPLFPLAEFKQLLAESPKPYLIIGSLPPDYVQLAMDYYPYQLQIRQGINFEYYIFCKEEKKGSQSIVYSFESSLDFNDEKEREGWNWQKSWVALDSQAINFYYQMPLNSEWGATFEMPLDSLVQQKNSFIDLALQVRQKDLPPSGSLVLEIKNAAGESICWLEQKVNSSATNAHDWQTIYLSLRLAHWIKNRKEIKNATFKAYFWNKEKQAVQLDRFRVRVRLGNPILYKDTDNFDEAIF